MSDTRPIIALDVDDVLADYAEGFVAFSNLRWGTNLSVDDYDEDWAKVWKLEIEEVRKRADHLHEVSFLKDMQQKSEARPVLEHLSKRFHLIVITSRRIQAKEDTILWIRTYYPMIDADKIHFSGFFDEINQHSLGKTKGPIARELGASYLIDDQIKHCIAAAEEGMQALLFGKYSWNAADSLPDGIERVADWQAVRRYFDAIDV